jgi:hypothetical protein
MTLKAPFLNLLLLAIAAGVGLLLCEGIARLTLRPADYLSVEMVKDDVLGAVPSSYTKAGGFDAWGFRNNEVPDTADIVVIGDSQTYGSASAMNDSWPYALGRLTGRRVYNMALGGYGPNQYLHLLKTKALSLKPRMIIVGLSMGDDFENAFLITYGLDHWAYLRALPAEKVNLHIWEAPSASTWHKKARIWLSRHSVMYQIIVHGPVLGWLYGEIEIQNALRLFESASLLSVPEKNILEAFLPKEFLRRNDQQNPNIREGMRITLELMAEMHDICRQNHVEFLVTVIPTKEMVFSEYFERDPNLALSDVLRRLVANERIGRETMFRFFTEAKVAYADALPALQRAAEHKIFTRLAGDMHPNKDGYRLIAEAAFEAVKKIEAQK